LKPDRTIRPLREYVPSHFKLININADYVIPDSNKVVLKDGTELTYDALVVATGTNPDFHAVEGLYDALEDKDAHVGSIYNLKYAVKYRDIYHTYYRPEY